MKKVFALIITMSLLLTLAPAGAALAAPGKGNGANVIDVNGFHYTLNILGKKADWNGEGGGGSTIHVPANSEEMFFTAPDGITPIEGIKIGIELGPDYMVTDGNAFDDGQCTIQLPKATYRMYIAMRGKPGFSADIKGWIYDSDSDISLFEVGNVKVSRKWKECTDELLYVDLSSIYGAGYENIYTLDLLEGGIVSDPDGNDLQIDEYFWSLVSNGAKIIKIRLYPD